MNRALTQVVRQANFDWPRFVTQLLRDQKQLNAHEISVVTFCIPKQEIQVPVLEFLATSAIPKLVSMDVGDISHLLSGFAEAKFRNDLLFDLASREIGRKLHLTTVFDLAHIFSSYRAFGYPNELLFEAIAKRLILTVPLKSTVIPAQIFTSLIQSAASSETATMAKLQTVLATSIASQIDRFDALAIAETTHVFARTKKAPFLLQVLLDEAFQRRSEFQGKAVALLVDAVGSMSTGNRGTQKIIRVSDGKKMREIGIDGDKITLLLDFFVSDIHKRGVKNFDVHSLALLSNGLAQREDKKNEKIFTLIADRVAGISHQLTPFSIALLAKSFAAVNVRHGPLLFNLPRHLEADSSACSLEEIATVMQAYARLGIRDSTLLKIVPKICVEILGSVKFFPDVTPLIDLLEAYGMLVVNEENLLTLLVKAIDENSIETTDFNRIQNCLEILQIETPPTLLEKFKQIAH